MDKKEKKEEKVYRWSNFDASGIRKGMDYELFGNKPLPSRHWRWTKDKAEKAIETGDLRPNPKTGRPEYKIYLE